MKLVTSGVIGWRRFGTEDGLVISFAVHTSQMDLCFDEVREIEYATKRRRLHRQGRIYPMARFFVKESCPAKPTCWEAV